MKKNLAIGAIAVIFFVGLVLYTLEYRFGGSLIFVSIFGLGALILWSQEQLATRIAKIDRTSSRTLNSVQWGNQEILKYSASIFRRVQSSDYRLPNSGVSSDIGQSGGFLSTASVGRGATPDVKNPNARETFSTMLDPNRELNVTGIFFTENIPGVRQTQWFPGSVLDSLNHTIPDYVIIDELAIAQSPAWKESLSAVGTSRMKEILSATAWLKQKGIITFRIPANLPPDVHSGALRNAPITHLPFDETIQQSDFGGPHTELFERLQNLAVQRKEAGDD